MNAVATAAARSRPGDGIRSVAAAIYLLVLFWLLNAMVILLEEPHLLHERGAEYDEYRRRVPRWL